MAITKELVDRINELAHKNKSVGLTQEEIDERAALRQAYLAGFRENFKKQMENVKFVEDLTEAELEEIAKEKMMAEKMANNS